MQIMHIGLGLATRSASTRKQIREAFVKMRERSIETSVFQR
jgi:hypothetical protein